MSRRRKLWLVWKVFRWKLVGRTGIYIILESDNATIVNTLKDDGINRSMVAPIVLDAATEKMKLKSLVVAKIGREQNNVAHDLAHRARRSGESRVWFADFLEALSLLLVKILIDK